MQYNDCIQRTVRNKMLTSQVLKSRVGLHYTLRLANKGNNLPSSIKAESFIDQDAALRFVNNLQVPLFFWENLAQNNTFFNYRNWLNANPSGGIESYIALSLVQGNVQAYQSVSLSELNESRNIRSFKDTQGKGFELQPAANLLVNTTAEVKPVHDNASAIQILQDLDISAQSAESLNKSLNLPASNGNTLEALKTALVNGEVVVTQQAEALKPNTGQDFVETVFEAPKPATEPPPQAAQKPAQETPAGSATRAENATADGLTKAAEEGTPFCEECETAKSAA